MPYPGDFPEPQPAVDWDELQRHLSPDSGLDDVPGFRAEGSFTSQVKTEPDLSWAGSLLLNETLELEKRVQELVDAKRPYVVIEKSLKQMGYQPFNIRHAFQKLTGIDPVRTFLDADNYPPPPPVLPRYNYGWAQAKDAEDEYLFVLPWISKYGLFRQKGLERTLEAEYWTLEEARQALGEKGEEIREVTPDGADTLTDLIQRTAKYAALSQAGAELYLKAEAIRRQDADLAVKMALAAHDEEKITDRDFKIIGEMLVEGQDPTEWISAPERVDERTFDEFRDEQEGRSFEETKQNATVPGQALADDWQSRHKVDFWGLLSESHDFFKELVSTVQGFKIEPAWGSFRIMPMPNLTLDAEDKIVDGAVSVGAIVTRLEGGEQSEIALLMFIHNGKLAYDGKFKGTGNERAYGLTTSGLDSYFNDLEGTTALDRPQLPQGQSAIPAEERPGPL